MKIYSYESLLRLTLEIHGLMQVLEIQGHTVAAQQARLLILELELVLSKMRDL